MDLFVGLQKLDAGGRVVMPFSFLNALEDGPVALGWLRVSHRELDAERSTPQQPWHTHRVEEPLRAGEIVPVEIEIWPSGTRFEKGEQLQLVIQGSDVQQYPAGVVSMGHSVTRNAGTHIIHTGGLRLSPVGAGRSRPRSAGAFCLSRPAKMTCGVLCKRSMSPSELRR